MDDGMVGENKNEGTESQNPPFLAPKGFAGFGGEHGLRIQEEKRYTKKPQKILVLTD